MNIHLSYKTSTACVASSTLEGGYLPLQNPQKQQKQCKIMDIFKYSYGKEGLAMSQWIKF